MQECCRSDRGRSDWRRGGCIAAGCSCLGLPDQGASWALARAAGGGSKACPWGLRRCHQAGYHQQRPCAPPLLVACWRLDIAPAWPGPASGQLRGDRHQMATAVQYMCRRACLCAQHAPHISLVLTAARPASPQARSRFVLSSVCPGGSRARLSRLQQHIPTCCHTFQPQRLRGARMSRYVFQARPAGVARHNCWIQRGYRADQQH